MADGRRLSVLVIVDDRTRECLALIPDTSICGARVARELDRSYEIMVRNVRTATENKWMRPRLAHGRRRAMLKLMIC